MLGGVPTAVETIRRDLEALGHQVVIVAPRMTGAGPVGPEGERGVIRVPAVPAPTYPDFALPMPLGPSLTRRLRSLALDVFHAHHPFLLGVSARRVARAAGRPFVFTYHTLYERYAHYVPLPRQVVVGRAIRWSARVRRHRGPGHRPLRLRRAPSPDPGRAAAHRGAADRSRSRPFPPRRSPCRPQGPRARHRRARAPLRRPPGPREEPRVPPGRGGSGQGSRDPVAPRRTRNAGGGVAARRVGERPRSRVEFRGGSPPAGLPAYYQAADAFVFASTSETQGLAVLEAMACGSRSWPCERAASRRSSPMGSRVSSCPRTPRRSRGRSIRSWLTPTWGPSSASEAGRPPRRSGRRRWPSGWWPRTGGPGESRRGAEAGRSRPRRRGPGAKPRRAPGDYRARDPAGAGGGAGPNGRAAPADARSAGRAGPRLDEQAETGSDAAGADLVRSDIAIRNRLRDEAARVRHHLIIQREALGFSRQTPVEQCYPVPERRRLPGPAGGRGREP